MKLGLVLLQGKYSEFMSFKLNFPNWQKRAVIALKMIKLLKTLETSFDIPMDMCDMRCDNVGVNDQNEIALMDTDITYFGWPVAEDNQYCVTDIQCSLLGCESYCNHTTRKCGGIRTNNNLQVIK